MNKKLFLSIVGLLLGEAIIIYAFLLCKHFFVDDAFALNVVVVSLMYFLLFIDVFKPLINLKEKHPKEVGSLGPRWFFSWGYIGLGLLAIYLCNFVYRCPVQYQLLIQGCLLLVLIFGFVSVFSIGDKVAEVAVEEEFILDGVVQMKNAIGDVSDVLCEKSDIPMFVVQQIEEFNSSLQFLSPIKNPEAHKLENEFVATMTEIRMTLSNYNINEDRIITLLKRGERILLKRKQVYSL